MSHSVAHRSRRPHPRLIRIGAVAAFLMAVSLLVLVSPTFAADLTGDAIYKQECARCHGPAGGGTKKAARPLVGDKSLPQLSRLIQRTMPDDDPGGLSEADAGKVAAYVNDAFYSPDAQAKANPPRVELARLTIQQYRNSIADLIGDYRATIKPDERRGLRGEYFDAKNFQNDRRRIDRIDSEVRFDFGTVGPLSKEPFNPNTFCIRWEGSVLAQETGGHEFIVRTEHALRLWVNDLRTPLIDAMVKSGSDTEFRGSIYLLAGRSCSLRLEFSKGRQLGVADKQKPPPPVQASIALRWKTPHGAEEVIPARYLSPVRSAEVAVIETPFPPDDRSYGWERGTTISREWVAAASTAALETAAYVSARLPELSGVPENASDRAGKLRAFCRTLVERAFRRPLTDAERKRYVDGPFDTAADPAMGVKRVVLGALNSPAFLYPDLSDVPAPYAAASRLAYTLWDSPPDKALLEAAAAGKLRTHEELCTQAQRMLGDPRAKSKVRQFLMAWLHVDHSPELVKDAKRFKGFDASLAADLRTSLELFLDDIVWSQRSDFRQLLLSDEDFLNGRLSAFYGGGLPADAGFQKVKLEPGKRAGVITHPYMLAVLAYAGESSPIHRGVFIARGLLGVTLRPPQEAFVPLAAELHPDLTMRQRVTLQTKSESCVGCHGIINPIGFALEDFDAAGRYRETEGGRPIDVTGQYETRAGPMATFDGARQLATYLAGSEDVHGAFVQQLFQHLVKQPVRAYGLQKLAELRTIFAESGYSVRKLIVEIAAIAGASEGGRH